MLDYRYEVLSPVDSTTRYLTNSEERARQIAQEWADLTGQEVQMIDWTDKE